MKVICLDHDKFMGMSKNSVSRAIKHLHWQLPEISVKPTAAQVWVKCEIIQRPGKLSSVLVSLCECVCLYIQIISNAKLFSRDQSIHRI